jgi:hypothetical protein
MWKENFSQHRARSSGIPPWEANSISQLGEAEKTTEGRDSPTVSNLPLLFIEVTFLGASSSDIPPQGASGSGKPVKGASSSGIPQQEALASSKPVDEGDLYM